MAEIHNSSIPSRDLLTNETLNRLAILANEHEYGLAYNISDTTRAIAGMQLAGEILSYMNSTITSSGSKKLSIQFGPYATALSLFGLLDLPAISDAFTGIIDYASSLVFELVTDADTSAGFPAAKDLSVRFLFHNGTASSSSPPSPFPLFGGKDLTVPWTTFQSKVAEIAVSSTEQWCTKCGNSTGTCAAYAGSTSTQKNDGSSTGHSNISPAVGGVIGAMVTLTVILGLMAAYVLFGGVRIVSKKALAGAAAVEEGKVILKA